MDALLAGVTDSLPVEGTWRERVKQLLARYLLVLYDHPEIARMTLTTHLSGPNYLAVLEQLLALLQEGGLADQEAAWASDLLLLYATAVAAEHSTRQSSSQAADEDQVLVAAITTADASRYPHVARLGGALFSGSGMERFAWGIDMFLNGVLHSPRAGREQENV
jgi:hypothetical protein